MLFDIHYKEFLHLKVDFTPMLVRGAGLNAHVLESLFAKINL